jgi:hypothetical protein
MSRLNLCSRSLALLGLLFSMSSLVSAADAAVEPCKTQRNTQEINACVKHQLDAAEAELNETYKAVLAALADPDGLGRPQDGVRTRVMEAEPLDSISREVLRRSADEECGRFRALVPILGMQARARATTYG